jgi:predicted 3-demethylubiquinone-9 3-methyltransferase (glyoxalase superfamily)
MPISMTPFLMFQGDAAAALERYQAIFPEARIEVIERYPPDAAGAQGRLKRARLSLAGQAVLVFDSDVKHAFGFTPSFSFWLECASEEELRRLAGLLAEDGGGELMPAGDYGFSRLFAWVSDRFGVSWQLNLA